MLSLARVEPAAPLAVGDTWQHSIEAFLHSPGRESEHTRRAYRRALCEFFDFTGCRDAQEVTSGAMLAFRRSLEDDGRAPGTHALTLSAVRAFLLWAAGEAEDAGFPLAYTPGAARRHLKSPRAHVERPYQVATDREVSAMFGATDNARDRALLAVMLGAGLRRSEVVALDVGDLRESDDGAGGVLHVRCGKGRKDRLVPVWAEVVEAVRAYLAETGRTLADVGPLFRAHDRGAAKRARRRLSPQGVRDVVAKLATAAGVDAAKVLTCHGLRHSYAVAALRAGANIVAVSKNLGHASIATTQRYLDHLDLDERRLAAPRLAALRPAAEGEPLRMAA